MPNPLNKLPTIDELRTRLNVFPVNTGKVYNYRGIVFDNNEELHAILNEHDKVQFNSGVEMPMQVYRGQSRDYGTCCPNLGRFDKVSSQLLAICRNVAFEEAIGEHPFVKKVESAKFLNSFLYVDKKGLAQHYGLATDLIDVTSNFDVAAFFAVCKWNRQAGRYQPVRTASAPGVLFKMIPFLLTCAPLSDRQNPIFHYVGWQPLNRPEQQRACGVRLTKGQDFAKLPSVQKVYFRHNTEISERIWHSFDQGRALFPADPAADLAKQALELKSFTRDQVDLAWSRLESWKGRKYKTKKRRHMIKQEKIQLLDKAVLTWDDLNVEHDEQKLQEKLNCILEQVKFRRVMYSKDPEPAPGQP